jgi:hypothetical protein
MSQSIRYYSGVGSRETPVEIMNRMSRLGTALCDMGYRGRSGLAPGADLSFYQGAQLSQRFDEIGFDNYLPNEWIFRKPEFGGFIPDENKRIFNAKLFSNYEKARELALEARGSFNGLKNGGIELHCRNSYQVLGHELIHPSKILICYAKPIGAANYKEKCKVSGGTNTAVQIAYKYNIEVVNLWWPENIDRVDRFLVQHK